MSKRKQKTKSTVDQRLKAVENMLNKTMENKVRDYSLVDQNNTVLTPDSITTSGQAYRAFLRNLRSGDEQDDRIGNKITLMSQTIRGTIRAPAGVTDEQQNHVRILIVENVGFTGLSDLALNDVLEYGTFGVFGTLVFQSPYKSSASENKRYKVHYDKVIRLNKTDRGYFDFKKRIVYGTKTNKGKVVTFSGPLADYPNNHRLCMFVISDSGLTSHPDIMWNVRNIYKDA